MSELDEFVGAVLDEKYRLEKLLGKGGMGAVFLATHLGTERPVAVKLIAPRLMKNSEFVRRFSREAKAAGRLRHPNVVDVTDFGVATTPRGPLAYLVMEYLDGCTLGDILAEEKQLPLEWAADILEQTCSAVHEAHQLGIVHRDLKPDNIWLEPNRLGGYRVKVLDFGLAKLAAPTLPAASQVTENRMITAPQVTRSTTENRPLYQGYAPTEDENALTLGGPPLTLDGSPTLALEADALTAEHSLTGKQQAAGSRQQAANSTQQAIGKQHAVGKQQAVGGEQIAANQLNEGGEVVTPVHLTDGGAVVTPTHLSEDSAVITPTNLSDEGNTLTPQDLATDAHEAATVAWPTAPQDDDPEAATRDFPALVAAQAARAVWEFKDNEANTKLFDAATTPTADTGTALDGNVTRVGAVIGTPLYMSPEQCRGEKLTVASDIYSLGVIAYQMLSGETPFTGNSLHVMNAHRTASPPSLRLKNPKIPKRIARLVNSALAKEPRQRPPSAAAFASMFRARATGTATLVRDALNFYNQHLFTLLKVSAVCHLPLFVILLLSFLSNSLKSWDILGGGLHFVFKMFLNLFSFLSQMVTVTIITGVTVLMVIQLTIAPLRPVRTRKMLELLRPKLKPLLSASLLVMLLWLGAMLYPFPPLLTGIAIIILFTLYSPVILVEDLTGLAALQRSGQLVLQVLGTVIIIAAVQWMIPLAGSVIFQRLAGGLEMGDPYRVEVVGWIAGLLNIFLTPLIAILNALLYLRVRQTVGEPLSQLLAQFDQAEMPTSHWQRRMRERLTLSK